MCEEIDRIREIARKGKCTVSIEWGFRNKWLVQCEWIGIDVFEEIDLLVALDKLEASLRNIGYWDEVKKDE